LNIKKAFKHINIIYTIEMDDQMKYMIVKGWVLDLITTTMRHEMGQLTPKQQKQFTDLEYIEIVSKVVNDIHTLKLN